MHVCIHLLPVFIFYLDTLGADEGFEWIAVDVSFSLGFIKYNMMRTMHKQDEPLGTHNWHVIQKECQTHRHRKQLQLHPFPSFHFESGVKPEDFCTTHSQLRLQSQQSQLREMVETRFAESWTGDVQMFQHRIRDMLLLHHGSDIWLQYNLVSKMQNLLMEDVSSFDHFHSGHNRPGRKVCLFCSLPAAISRRYQHEESQRTCSNWSESFRQGVPAHRGLSCSFKIWWFYKEMRLCKCLH